MLQKIFNHISKHANSDSGYLRSAPQNPIIYLSQLQKRFGTTNIAIKSEFSIQQ
jgi:hypothetical protein